MRLAHTQDYRSLRRPTVADPWRVLVSGCMLGMQCGVDGTDYGLAGRMAAFFALPQTRALPFCPELVALGAPRPMPDIHNGDGRDVIRGTAKVLDPQGNDMTEGMLIGARAMLAFAREHDIDLAILTDMSAACGSQVISDGCRFDQPRRYQRGLGVAAAMLDEAGYPIVSQRDFRTLERLVQLCDPQHTPNPAARDHHHHPWTREYFNLPAAETPRQ